MMHDALSEPVNADSDVGLENDAAIANAAERLILCIEHLGAADGDVDSGEILDLYNGEAGELAPHYLTALADIYNLDKFERRVLLLCLTANMDSEFSGLARELQGLDFKQAPVTVSLALSLFSDGGHDHFLPGSRLCQNQLIRLDGHPLYEAAITLDPALLGYLVTGNCEDASLAGLIVPLLADMDLTEAQSVAVRSAADNIINGTSNLQLVGTDRATVRAVAAQTGANIGCGIFLLSFFQIPANAGELADIAARWRRKALLDDQILAIDTFGVSPTDRDFAAASYLLQQFVALADVPVFILCGERINFELDRQTTLEIPAPGRNELAALWLQVLYKNRCFLMAEYFGDEDVIQVSDEEDQNFAEELAACFAFSGSDIQSVANIFLSKVQEANLPATEALTLPFSWHDYWWQAARLQARPSFDGLARRVESTASFDTLVTDDHTGNILKEIINQFKARPLVRGLWGLEPAFQRGSGITVLFAGSSGTGKTLAAEVLANALSLDLYQIDLSQMVSKYIGETQKNLSRVFEAAERGGSILLFDEADALFSKRTDVKDAKDRHANMEVGYLLQRMEAYSGIAILTSNLKEGIDDAFLRRLQYVVDFPFPSAEMRAQLWQTMLPKAVPAANLPDPSAFARLTLTGAQIRNVIRRAVYRAASGSGELETDDLLHAAHAEMEKSDRALSPSDLRSLLEC